MAFAIKSIDNLFPMPIIRVDIADAAALNERLLAEISARRAAEAGVARSNKGGWHSAADFFSRKEPAHAALALDLLRIMAESTRKFDPDADYSKLRLIPDGWVNVNPPGAYNSPHDHRSAFWSGTYYVDVPDGEGSSGMIEFYHPGTPLPQDGGIGGPLTAESYCTRPSAGTVLLFPATMKHWVHPNGGTRDRVTIAFNGRFEVKR
ncbi:TIGR02466 family protein [Sphingomonas jaspsi]|uniref:TIGR02466 family protein n=1 Tax=Sphingomonas jaspsi TaxID=392409 RepID=UPI0004B9EB15|nr:TIGR02466 family protein [Sphingomonas jaspsi]